MEKARFELDSMKLQLALDIVSKLKPGLAEDEKLMSAFKMMKAIGTLGTSEIEATVRPRELPEA